MASHSKSVRSCAVTASLLLCTAAASASVHTWNFAAGMPGDYTLPDRGGSVHSIAASFDDFNSRLTWNINFADRVTEGFYLVITDGQSPLGQSAQHGVFFFDAYDVFDADPSASVVMTAYAYNGAPDHRSWLDGDAQTAGTQAADCIKPATDSGWIFSASAADVLLDGGIPGRSMSFSIDAADIIAHVPMYAAPGANWKGAGFADLLGIRLVPAEVFEVDYDAAGEIEWLGIESFGVFDGRELPTNDIPTPGSAALAMIGLSAALGRRPRNPLAPHAPRSSSRGLHSRR